MIASFRDRALETGQRELDGLTQIIANHFDHELDGIDARLGRQSERLRIQQIASPEEFSLAMAGGATKDALAAEVRDEFGSSDVDLFDTDGRRINSSRSDGKGPSSISDTISFQRFKTNATSSTSLTEPRRNVTSGTWTTVLYRKLVNENGVFLGVITKKLDPSRFERFLLVTNAWADLSVKIKNAGGELLAQFPRQFPSTHASFGPERSAVAPVGDADLLTSSRSLQHFPIIIEASKDKAVTLLDWHAQTKLLVITGFLLTSVTVAIFLLVGARLARQRRDAEAILELGKQRLDIAFANVSQGISLFDRNQIMVIANSRLHEIYSLRETVKVGMNYTAVLESMRNAGINFDRPIGPRAASNDVEQLYTCRLRNGRVVAIRRTPTPDGGWVSSHEDITDRELAAATMARQLAEVTDTRNRLEEQQAELIATTEQLAAAKDAAETANRAKSDFLAIMSHEVRTPMAGMMGMIDLLCQTSLDTEQKQLAEVAHDSAQNLLSVVNNILDFSKLEAGQLKPEAIDFSIRHAIKSIEMLLGPKARERGLRFEISVQEETPRWLIGDPRSIGQILLNLVGNAIKFTHDGAIKISVSCREAEDKRFALDISVEDTGVGISPEAIPALFNPFTQSDTSVSRKYGGTGLGLAICKQLCIAMGGEIGVDSVLGRGSRFWIRLTCAQGQPPVVTAPPLQADHPDIADIRILVAEDNDVLRSLISKLLANRGYKADLVENGAQAVDAAMTGAYDLILMDMQMPELDGVSATKVIRGLDHEIRAVPIVALTANALVGQREACLAAGMNDFVSKPIQPEALYAAVKRWSGVMRGTSKSAARQQESPTAMPLA